MDTRFTEIQKKPKVWTFIIRRQKGILQNGQILMRIVAGKLCMMSSQMRLMYNQFNRLGGIHVGTGRREFTEAERAILNQNPYTYRVFKNSIRFTIEFKETFMRQYEAGMSPTKIVEGMGYDAEMLGKRCINSLYRNLQKQQASPAGLHEGSLRSKKIQPGSTDYDAVTPKRAMQLMQHELLYLRQEVEFLKKL